MPSPRSMIGRLDMFHKLKAYLYAAALFVLGFAGWRIFQSGKNSGEVERASRRVDAMKKAKDVRDEVESDPHLAERAREWMRDEQR